MELVLMTGEGECCCVSREFMINFLHPWHWTHHPAVLVGIVVKIHHARLSFAVSIFCFRFRCLSFVFDRGTYLSHSVELHIFRWRCVSSG